jgi:hypothetical protein
MKRLILLAALTATLGAAPTFAQQGPAGVPGVFGLAESVTNKLPPPQPPPAPAAQPQRPARPIDCATSKQPEQCQARQEARTKALAACQGKTGAAHKECLNEQAQSADCKKTSDPARCLQFQKANKLCSAKIGPEHRQCLRDVLATKR